MSAALLTQTQLMDRLRSEGLPLEPAPLAAPHGMARGFVISRSQVQVLSLAPKKRPVALGSGAFSCPF